MKNTPDTMEDILAYLYCATETLALIRNEFDTETSPFMCVDALYGQVNYLRQLCGQLKMHIQQIPPQILQRIAKAVDEDVHKGGK